MISAMRHPRNRRHRRELGNELFLARGMDVVASDPAPGRGRGTPQDRRCAMAGFDAADRPVARRVHGTPAGSLLHRKRRSPSAASVINFATRTTNGRSRDVNRSFEIAEPWTSHLGAAGDNRCPHTIEAPLRAHDGRPPSLPRNSKADTSIPWRFDRHWGESAHRNCGRGATAPVGTPASHS